MFVHIGIEAARYSSILDPYRCSWYATKTVVLFATNIIENTGFEGILKSHDLLKSVLSTLQNVSFYMNNIKYQLSLPPFPKRALIVFVCKFP